MKNSILQLCSFVVLFCATSFSAMADATEFNGYWKNFRPISSKNVASIHVQANTGQSAKITLKFSDQRQSFAMNAFYSRGALIANNVNLGCREKYQVVVRMMRNHTVDVSFRPILEGKPNFRTCGYQRIRTNLARPRPTATPTQPVATTQGQSTRKQNPRTKPLIQVGKPRPNTSTPAKYPQKQQPKSNTTTPAKYPQATPGSSGNTTKGTNARPRPKSTSPIPQSTSKQDVRMHKTPPIVTPSPQTPKKGNNRPEIGENF